jgi:hypothetical protein
MSCTASICRAIHDQFIAGCSGTPPWSTKPFVCTLHKMEHHNDVSSGIFKVELHNQLPQQSGTPGTYTLKGATERFIVLIFAKSHCGCSNSFLVRIQHVSCYSKVSMSGTTGCVRGAPCRIYSQHGQRWVFVWCKGGNVMPHQSTSYCYLRWEQATITVSWEMPSKGCDERTPGCSL